MEYLSWRLNGARQGSHSAQSHEITHRFPHFENPSITVGVLGGVLSNRPDIFRGRQMSIRAGHGIGSWSAINI